MTLDVPTAGNGTPDKVVVTFKAGPGYDAPWIVFHANSNAEAADLIGAAEATGLFAEIGKASAEFKAAYNAGAGLGATPVTAPSASEAAYYQAPPSQAPQTAPQSGYAPPQTGGYGAPSEQPPGPPPTCPHGTKVFKPSGVSRKSGKPYGATWNCPAKVANWQDPNGCPTQWLNSR